MAERDQSNGSLHMGVPLLRPSSLVVIGQIPPKREDGVGWGARAREQVSHCAIAMILRKSLTGQAENTFVT